jgi:hypothetical protein
MIGTEKLKEMSKETAIVLSAAFLIVWACGFFWGRLTA